MDLSSHIIFCGDCILQLSCHNVEGALDIKYSQKQLKLKFCGSRDLRLTLPEAATP